jgi:UDP-N-acetylmuramoyl-tripeptide--D-alanyl-D-alanine ligase
MSFAVKLAGNNHGFFIPILGNHNVYNALFAIAVADRLGFTPEQIMKGLKTYNRPASRLRVIRLKKDVCLIDDSFNANPNSVNAAIDVLSKIGGNKNIAVLATMSELGRYSERGHKEVGKYLAARNVTHLFTFGKAAKLIGTEAISHGFPHQRVVHSMDRRTMHKRLKMAISPGSTILVKGSHNMMMNKTVSFLKQQSLV